MGCLDGTIETLREARRKRVREKTERLTKAFEEQTTPVAFLDHARLFLRGRRWSLQPSR